MVKFVEIEAKSVLNKHKFKDNWFWDSYSINPYRGCQFACNYCDAISQKYLTHQDYHDFTRTIYVKKNAPKVLEKEIRRFEPDIVGLSGVTDPYQPVEGKYQLTRKILKILAKNHFPVHIGTKSDLILRDIDLLKEISLKTWCTVSFTIITFNKDLLSYLEPLAPSPERRLEALRKLNEEGIRTGVNFMPIVPYISDSPENIEEVINRVSEHAKYILIGSGMSLRSNQRIRFMELLERNFPELIPKYEKLYGNNMGPARDYVVSLNRIALEFCEKYGIKNYIDPPNFNRHPEQATLIPTEDYDKINRDVANHLLLMAFFKEYKSGNFHVARNYHVAAENIENLTESVRDIHKRNELELITGVGKTISKVIAEFLD